ncbi:PKD domain-containing protein [Candidatus Bipolaricaulota bacterium]|nr:PKD domain-containing protein [Candidatus Bipolaricaulota bacterium]
MKKQYRSILSIGLLSVLVVSLVFMLTGCGTLTNVPEANIEKSPDSISAGDEVEFDGSSSEPGSSDGEIISYDWTFPDEFTLGSSPDEEVQTGSFDSSDTYTVYLTVTDDTPASDTTSIEVEVS